MDFNLILEMKPKDQLIQLFDTLGTKNELALKGRRKLSSMIFS